MKKLVSSLAVAAAAAFGSTAAVAAGNFLEFTVDETSIPGTGLIPGLANPALVADKLNGGFAEYVTFTSATTFEANAFASLGQMFANEGVNLVTSLLSGNELVGGYRMYALFSAQGNVAGLNFTATSQQLSLYIDVDSNTSFVPTPPLAGAGLQANPLTLSSTSDDYMIASTSSLVGVGTGTLSSAPGAYNFDFKDLLLTSGDLNATFAGNQNGELFFVAPRPFHLLVQVNGDNDQATPVVGTTILVTGDVSAVFKAPEPGSLALVGTLLAGLGLASRRRKA